MVTSELKAVAVRWGGVGVLTAAVATGAAALNDFPLLLLGMILFGVPLMIVPLTVGVTDTGIDSASASAVIGDDIGNPQDYDPGNVLPIPGKVQAVCWLSGVGVGGFALLVWAA
ncbi:hypothetical protein [Halobacterium litoreum]|uniref:Uncharacterized protein n=1 Tax=Halobacterium litoreum TaxID=2039234 RepID=A0ABD5NEP1_9EURY|nr:hypothetical protein [Halobacterium litoreum]UHH13787.1 hypothetical protein LT972_02030 [Halobacterium litoreum]